MSSLNRPGRIRKVVECYPWGDETIILALWAGDPSLRDYLDAKWPATWNIEIVEQRGNGPTYEEILRRYPDERAYGFLADDAILDVPGMLRKLEDAAGRWNIAYPNDGKWCERNCTMPCIGGDLVREVGYLAPPGFMHWGIDNVWHAIGARLNALRYMPELTYTHLHPLFGTAPNDSTYDSAFLNSVGWEQVFRAWQMDGLEKINNNVTTKRGVAHGRGNAGN